VVRAAQIACGSIDAEHTVIGSEFPVFPGLDSGVNGGNRPDIMPAAVPQGNGDRIHRYRRWLRSQQ
jgi:hypothetical protein